MYIKKYIPKIAQTVRPKKTCSEVYVVYKCTGETCIRVVAARNAGNKVL